MTTCNNCKKQSDIVLRANEKGIDAIWWCLECMESKEPELYKNEIEDYGQLLEDLTGRKL
jgi:ssDNA-binding Zn-finger/Zn-ribbon topoisomerase 1